MRGEAMLKLASTSRLRPRRRDELIADAEAHAAEAVRLEPAAAGGYLVHAKACLAQGSAAGASGWAERALSVEPDDPVGHQLLGLAAQLRGDAAAAADHYVDAGKLNPRSDTSIRLLRGLRTSLPIGGLAIFLIIRTTRTLGGMLGGVVAVIMVIAVILVLLGYQLYGPRWRARREMSDQARHALARDRELRRWRPRR